MLSLRVMLRTQKAQILGIHVRQISISSSLSSTDPPSDSNDHSGKDPKKTKSKEDDNISAEDVLNNVMNAKPLKHNINISVTPRTPKIKTNEENSFDERLSAAAENISQYYKSNDRSAEPSIARELQEKYRNVQNKKIYGASMTSQIRGGTDVSQKENFEEKLSAINKETGPSILRELQENYMKSQKDKGAARSDMKAETETDGPVESKPEDRGPSILRELKADYIKSQTQKRTARSYIRAKTDKHQEENFEEKLSATNEETDKPKESDPPKRGPSILRQLKADYIKSRTQQQAANRMNARDQTIQEMNGGQFERKHDMSETELKEGTYDPQKTEKRGPVEQSHVKSLLKQYLAEKKIDGQQQNKFLNTSEFLHINTKQTYFQYTQEDSAGPQLKTWDMLEEKKLKMAITLHPSNPLDEMIQWTLQGKLWQFPIDNEQGIEDEHNVHFSEHVFMDRHLQDWCPKNGPVRHFMELVCVGLSKNPYMTVEEKVEHIMWYKNYFAEKKSLLDVEVNEPSSNEAANVVA